MTHRKNLLQTSLIIHKLMTNHVNHNMTRFKPDKTLLISIFLYKEY